MSYRSMETGFSFFMGLICELPILFLRIVSLRSYDILFYRISQGLEFIENLPQRLDLLQSFLSMITQLTESNHCKYFTLVDDTSKEEWRLDSRIMPLSQFLKHMDLQVNEDRANILTIQIPSFLKADGRIMQLIGRFYEMHEYVQGSIKVSKIKITKQKPFDIVTQQFVQWHLRNQTQQTIKKAMNMVEYLKLNSLKDVLSTYVATLYYCNHNDNQINKFMEENNIFYSRQMEINLKRGMLDYSKQFSKDVLQQYREKEGRKRELLNNKR